LVLGGVRVPDAPHGLAGHSDADVLTHAVIDALLGAAGLGDIGQHFPDSEERWRDADSIDLLRTTRSLLADAGVAPTHIDATVVCETPRLSPFRDEMRARVASAVGLDPRAVNVKFTTAERMGFVGRGEGLAALAIATVA
jgi:2-C-methyl-D-erythritol 2,4-cyclodiphosphate synthase